MFFHQACYFLQYLCETTSFTCTCPDVNDNFGFEQKYWRFDGFGEKRHGSADLHTPIYPPPYMLDKRKNVLPQIQILARRKSLNCHSK